MRDRGYTNPKHWSAEGWGWKTFRNVKWPTFWIPDGPQGLHRWEGRPWGWGGQVLFVLDPGRAARPAQVGLGVQWGWETAVVAV